MTAYQKFLFAVLGCRAFIPALREVFPRRGNLYGKSKCAACSNARVRARRIRRDRLWFRSEFIRADRCPDSTSCSSRNACSAGGRRIGRRCDATRGRNASRSGRARSRASRSCCGTRSSTGSGYGYTTGAATSTSPQCCSAASTSATCVIICGIRGRHTDQLFDSRVLPRSHRSLARRAIAARSCLR